MINSDRLWARIAELSAITEPDRPWTRRSFTPRFLEGRKWLEGVFREAGLSVRLDTAGNLIGRREGSEQGLPPILIGSHSDTVPSGGRYDGILGVLAAVEVAETLKERGVALRHPLEVIDFLAEEPSDFGLSCIGSRAFAGALDDTMLALTRPDGMSLREGIRFVGGDPDRLSEAQRPAGGIAGYIEVHIEQGRVLEDRSTDIAIVSDIVGIHRDTVTVTGRTDHAGATPMPLRADALVGASRIIDAVWRMALPRAGDAKPLVATVGHAVIRPNAANAVPGEVVLTVEVRSGDEEATRTFLPALLADIAPALAELRVAVRSEFLSHAAPAPCADSVRQAIAEGAAAAGLSTMSLPSGAGHDGVFVSRIGPMGMIFTPCREGRSHCPEEAMDQHEAANGAKALYGAVLSLDRTADA